MNHHEKTVTRHGGPRLLFILILIGIFYVSSLVFFLTHDDNFVSRAKIETAENWARMRRLPVPSYLPLDSGSGWATSLAVGWNAPESWGVWSNASQATVVLPPVSDSKKEFCIRFKIGALTSSKKRKWLFKSFVNEIKFSENYFTGPGPYEIQGMVRSTGEKIILIKFIGPTAKVPNSNTASTDARMLSYFINDIKITQFCEK